MVIKALDPDWIRIRIGVHPKMLDPDPDAMNTDPQPCFFWWCLAPLNPAQRFLNAGLRIRDMYPVDQNCFHPGSGFFFTEGPGLG